MPAAKWSLAKPPRRGHCLLAGAFLAMLPVWACGKRSVQPRDPGAVIFNKFTAVPIAAAALPKQPTEIAFLPGTSEFIVLGKSGEVVHFSLETSSARRLGSLIIPGVAPAPGEIGLTGAAVDPAFAANGFIYLCYTTGDNRTNRVIRLRWSNNYDTVGRSITPIIAVDREFPDEPEHGIYDLCFGADGYLYTAMGDATQPQFAQEPSSLLGKLLRLAPERTAAGGYRIPPDNPFVAEEGARPEIAALGLRAPFRLVPWQDKIFIAEVGQNQYEGIEMYSLGKVNFGWPLCEGICENGLGFRNPVLTVSHDDPLYATQDPENSTNDRLSISLGVAYPAGGRDPYDDLLDGRLIFNDVFQGYVRAARILPNGALTDDQHIFHLDFVTAMDIGPDGYIYGVTIFEEQLFRVELRGN